MPEAAQRNSVAGEKARRERRKGKERKEKKNVQDFLDGKLACPVL